MPFRSWLDRRRMPGMPKHGANVRLFVDQSLRQGGDIAVGGGRANYLTRVMRLQSGDGVLLFNGSDGEWLARIRGVSRGWCELQVDGFRRAQREEPGPVLAFAPIKKEPMHVLVEKATELGVERLVPVLTRNTAAERVNLDRVRTHAVEAAEQCGRLTIPAIDAPTALNAFIAQWAVPRPLLFLDERRSGRRIADAVGEHVARFEKPAPAPGILVGPEGGFAAEEAESLRAHPFCVPVGLGPRILRAETAAIAALACWQAFAGDWRAANDSE
jgi:16S rRNA (uracil1498-N3)-methyltransferase